MTAEDACGADVFRRLAAMISRSDAHGSIEAEDLHGAHNYAPLDRRIVVESAMAMIDLIRTDELSRLSVRADERCEGLVLDLSRNRSRRFCSTTCANRNAVAAYRARGRRRIP